ncbi:MAG: hypothetical protein RLZZ574_459 [Cyanobacteriota bacterium]|jgi:phosphonate transport system substrate-binding protein
MYFYRRLLIVFWSILLGIVLAIGCASRSPSGSKLVIGVVSYDAGASSVDKYENFQNYLAAQTKSIVELEPAFNELTAVEEVKRGVWSIVFAPPGLAAIAIKQQNYLPIFSMAGLRNVRSVIVVNNNRLQNLDNLSNNIVALGQPGSAAGYYLPLYDLYGLTLKEVRFAPTPKTVLQWLSQGEVDAGALSEADFELYHHEFEQKGLRILHTTRSAPPSIVLLRSSINAKSRQQIIEAMKAAAPSTIGDAGYLPDATIPNYEQFIKIVEKVRPLETQVQEKPAVLIFK